MHPRTKERKRALDVLHAADLTGRALLDVLAEQEEPLPPFARRLVEGVARTADEIDGVIRAHADRWPLERMPVVDRNILRLGLFELLHERGTPAGVVINESVELAKLLSTEESGRFVNGLLGRIARERDGGSG